MGMARWRTGSVAKQTTVVPAKVSALDLFTLCCQRGQSVVHESLPCVVNAVRVLSTKVVGYGLNRAYLAVL